MNKDEIRRQAKYALARKDFWYYCQLSAPDFYKPDRKYLKEICNELQAFHESSDEVLIINAPPRHGKTRTVSLYTSWVLGEDQSIKVMTGSYNERLSTTLSKSVRNKIMEVKADEEITVFSDIFPGVGINRGDGAMNLWSLNGGYYNYLATSPKGVATGFGADLIIIDDLIKSALEANNAGILEEHWGWFTDTITSRLEEKAKLILVMTRWSSKDLSGKVLEWCQKEGKKYRQLTYKAHIGNGEMLCPEILSYGGYMGKKSIISNDILSANYDQIPIDVKGRLYKAFRKYSFLPVDGLNRSLIEKVVTYVDTADQGSDFLCAITVGIFQNHAYVLDVYYTQEGMEKTEDELAKRLIINRVNECIIESNNGGYGFARSLRKALAAKGGVVSIKTFTQTKNKRARILSNASAVMDYILYPEGWKEAWPDYARDMLDYQREGKNAHDDAPDATTGIVELLANDVKIDDDVLDAVKALGL